VERVLTSILATGGPSVHELPVDQARAEHERQSALVAGEGEPVAEVRELELPGPAGAIPARAYRPAGHGPLGVVAYLHGGGWTIGTVDSFDAVTRALANASGALVVSIDYRLAPEHPFPAALHDAEAAVRWLAVHAGELGGDPGRLAVAGDSAGGNLATVAARRLSGEVDVRLQALIYPATDAGADAPSYGECGEGFGLTAASMRRYWSLYLDGADGAAPDASPLRATDLAGSPPALIVTASHDPLRDDGELYAAALRDAGVPATLRRFDGTVHGFWRWLAVTDVSHRAIEEVGAALRAALT
jgi:acetyl esterase